ncbi:MAG TPA: WXG100 family type VII secretion target [Arachnia sp.]|nr:WXG100 family type VII secretion target [Arachnia sp.]
MNIDDVKRIAGDLKRQANDLQTVINQVDKLVSQSQSAWVGPDAKKFDSLWKSHRPRLLALKTELDNLSSSASKNADNQRTTSSTL